MRGGGRPRERTRGGNIGKSSMSHWESILDEKKETSHDNEGSRKIQKKRKEKIFLQVK